MRAWLCGCVVPWLRAGLRAWLRGGVRVQLGIEGCNSISILHSLLQYLSHEKSWKKKHFSGEISCILNFR